MQTQLRGARKAICARKLQMLEKKKTQHYEKAYTMEEMAVVKKATIEHKMSQYIYSVSVELVFFSCCDLRLVSQ